MTKYVETVKKHRRLTILKFLKDSPEYTSNGSIITEICNTFGVASSHDQVVGELQWLAENSMVTLDTSASDFVVVSATKHGIDIAEGRARHDGVKRPSPEG
jgi:hypothetical protein